MSTKKIAVYSKNRELLIHACKKLGAKPVPEVGSISDFVDKYLKSKPWVGYKILAISVFNSNLNTGTYGYGFSEEEYTLLTAEEYLGIKKVEKISRRKLYWLKKS